MEPDRALAPTARQSPCRRIGMAQATFMPVRVQQNSPDSSSWLAPIFRLRRAMGHEAILRTASRPSLYAPAAFGKPTRRSRRKSVPRNDVAQSLRLRNSALRASVCLAMETGDVARDTEDTRTSTSARRPLSCEGAHSRCTHTATSVVVSEVTELCAAWVQWAVTESLWMISPPRMVCQS